MPDCASLAPGFQLNSAGNACECPSGEIEYQGAFEDKCLPCNTILIGSTKVGDQCQCPSGKIPANLPGRVACAPDCASILPDGQLNSAGDGCECLSDKIEYEGDCLPCDLILPGSVLNSAGDCECPSDRIAYQGACRTCLMILPGSRLNAARDGCECPENHSEKAGVCVLDTPAVARLPSPRPSRARNQDRTSSSGGGGGGGGGFAGLAAAAAAAETMRQQVLADFWSRLSALLAFFESLGSLGN